MDSHHAYLNYLVLFTLNVFHSENLTIKKLLISLFLDIDRLYLREIKFQ